LLELALGRLSRVGCLALAGQLILTRLLALAAQLGLSAQLGLAAKLALAGAVRLSLELSFFRAAGLTRSLGVAFIARSWLAVCLSGSLDWLAGSLELARLVSLARIPGPSLARSQAYSLGRVLGSSLGSSLARWAWLFWGYLAFTGAV
jgi:hypothetical protein